MNIRYDVDRLEVLIKDLSNVTGVDISVRDVNFGELTRAYHKDGLCSAIHRHENGITRCMRSDEELLIKCRKSGKAETDVCHAGLSEVAVPVMKGGKMLGYVLIGRVRGETSEDEVKRRAAAFGVGGDRFEREFSALAMYDRARLDSIVNLVSALTGFILSSNMMHEEYSRLTNEITEFIDGNMEKKITVDVLCRAMHISKNTLYEHFHYDLNSTVSDYIMQRRIEKAKQLLITTDMTLDDIVSHCGIGSYTYLFKLMKKHTGMTPLQYRRCGKT